MSVDGAPSRLSSLQAVARARRSELPVRLGMAVVGAVALTLFRIPAAGAIVWCAVTFATQLFCLIAFGRFEDEEDHRPPSRIEIMACHSTVFVSSLWCSAAGAPFWFLGGASGKVFAMLWVCGALVHALLHMCHDRRVLATALLGHAIVLLSLPAIDGWRAGGVEGDAAWLVLLGAALFIAHLFIALRKNGAMSAMLRAGRERALEGKRAAEAASEATSRVLAVMSHELSAPMDGISSLARSLLQSDLRPTQRRQVEALEDASRMALSMLNNIQDLSKIEAGSMVIEAGEVDLRRLLGSLAALWRGRAEEKGLRLAAVVEEDAPVVVLADGLRLRQIISNLLANAVSLTDEGEVRLQAGVSRIDTRQARLRISVMDTSRGLDPESAGRLFEAFVPVEVGPDCPAGRSGLAIARSLARLMGGDVVATSRIGVGSRFSFEAVLPVLEWPARAPSVVITFDGPEDDGATIRTEWSEIELEDVTGFCPPFPLGRRDDEPEASQARRGADARSGYGGHGSIGILRGADWSAATHAEEQRLPLAYARVDTAGTRIMGAAADHRAGERGRLPPSPAEQPSATGAGPGPTGTSAGALDLSVVLASRLGPGLRICVVEDHPLNQRVIEAALHRLDCELAFAMDGQDALDQLSARSFNLVFMDLQMPVFDGFEVTRRIRSGGGVNAHTPIVGLTANVLPGARERCMAAGMDDFIAKPVDLGELYAVVDRVLLQPPRSMALAAQ
jgi:signal transduction histidine kinase/ActR/RegA family two-component response regulator